MICLRVKFLQLKSIFTLQTTDVPPWLMFHNPTFKRSALDTLKPSESSANPWRSAVPLTTNQHMLTLRLSQLAAKTSDFSQAWWCIPLIPTPERQRKISLRFSLKCLMLDQFEHNQGLNAGHFYMSLVRAN